MNYAEAQCAMGGVHTHNADYWSAAFDLNPGNWQTHSGTWNVNPATGLAWTWGEIADLQLALALNKVQLYGDFSRCTQIYAVVDYTPNSTQTIVLRPNAAGDLTQISYQIPGSGAHWDKVDEVTADGDSTYVSNSSSTYLYDLYNIQDSGLSAVHINGVAVFVLCKAINYPNWCSVRPVLKTNGGIAYGEETVFNNNRWVMRVTAWNLNPVTGVAWTIVEINALQIGLGMHRAPEYSDTVQCTQVYVLVNYTPNVAPNTPSIPSGPSRSPPGVSQSFSTAATDPEGDNVYYVFDWGDQQQSQTGWVASGQSASLSHSWAAPGTYQVKAAACDIYGSWSAWSSILTILIVSGGNQAIIL